MTATTSRERRGVVGVQHGLVELLVVGGSAVRAVRVPLFGDLLGQIGKRMSPSIPDGHRLTLDVDGVDDGVAFLPDELELGLTLHLDVELLLFFGSSGGSSFVADRGRGRRR